jgi:hypothetical protein
MKHRLTTLRQIAQKAYADYRYKQRGLDWYVQKADVDEARLKESYERSSIKNQTDDFALVRILGNDLYPRHRKGQTYDNLKFILENETAFDGCTKLWLLNRIACSEETVRIEALLQSHNQRFEKISFDSATYGTIDRDYSVLPNEGFLESSDFTKLSKKQQIDAVAATYWRKNNYVMNNNGARNRALEMGRGVAKWVLPWDGNCFLTPAAWNTLKTKVTTAPHFTHFLVPMARVNDNASLLESSAAPSPREEPQILFRSDTTTTFNESFYYGRRPKVELFWTLCVPGPWDTWGDAPWDSPRRIQSDEALQFSTAGWVARIASGMPMQEKSSWMSAAYRAIRRQEAIIETLKNLDQNSSNAS